MIKVIILVLIILFILAVGGTCGWYCIQKGQGEPPSVKEAPWVVTARVGNAITNMFYSADVETDGSTYILNGYWENRNDKWHFQERTIKLNENWGIVTLRRR